MAPIPLTQELSVSPSLSTQPKELQPSKLEFQYGWCCCEGGLKVHELSATANISGSSGFLWLLTLRPHQWSGISFHGLIPIDFEHQISTIWGNKISRSNRNANASIDFVACHPTDLHQFDDIDIPQVTFLTERSRSISLGSRKLLKIKHDEVGGVTTHIGHFLLSKCPPVALVPTVRRTIGSVIEHKRHLPSTDKANSCISPSDLLPIHSLGVAIRLPSLWSHSGFATRSLAGSELCTAFDLPSWSIPKHFSPIRYKLFFSMLQPIKALLAVADVLLPFVASRGHHLGSSALQVLPDISIDPRGSWISQPYWMQIKKENSLQRVNTLFTAGIGWLPLSWIDSSLVTDKAVKTDKASVPVHLWDQRICLPMGITKPKRFASIVVIRNFFYKIYRKRLIASFCRYMMVTYNQHWIYWLSQRPNLKQYFWLVRGQLRLLRGGIGGDKSY